MGLRSIVFVLLVLLALLAPHVPGAATASVPSATGVIQQLKQPVAPPAWLAPSTERISVMLELAGPAAVAAGNRDAMQLQSMRNSSAQVALAQPLAQLGAQVLYRTQLAYNGIAVSIPANQVEALRALPGVADIHQIVPKTRSHSPAAVTLAPSPTIWTGPGGATGRGIKIGIIDSGIDYTHADFGGPGTPAAYQNPNRTFPTAKVVGGYDFAGDNYDASGKTGSPIPSPKADPLDCNGHGTHVAGLAAGYGVTTAGETYRGGYDGPIDVTDFRIVPGVAPEADLYALKIFGCNGTTALVALAIERAIELDLDVINLSLGTPFGSASDPDAVAADNAALAGIVVVTAVGDGNGSFYATNTPASGQRVITVGASDGGTAQSSKLLATSARGPQRGNNQLKPDLVAPGLNLVSAAVGTGNQGISQTGTSQASPQVAGAVAALRQLHPNWSAAQIRAALINTATPVKAANGAAAPPSLGGAGQLNTGGLGQLDLLAYVGDSSRTNALTYGAPAATQRWSATRALTVENLSTIPRSISLSTTATITQPGVTLSVPPGPLTVPPRSKISVPVTAVFDPAVFTYRPDAATALRQDNFSRYFLTERGGYVQVSTGGGRVRPAHAAAVGPVQFVLDDTILGPALDPASFGDYQSTTAGQHTVRVLRLDAPPGAAPLLQATITVPQGQDVSLVLAGANGAFRLIVVDETPDAPPAAGRAQIHFVNAGVAGASPFDALDVYLDSDTPLIRNLALGATSPVRDLAPGTHVVTFFRAGEEPGPYSLVAYLEFSANSGELLTAVAGLALEGTSDNTGCDETAALVNSPAFANTPPAETSTLVCATRGQGVLGRGVSHTPTPVITLRVPYQILPSVASVAAATTSNVVVPASTTALAVPLANSGARVPGAGEAVGGVRTALVSAFELNAASNTIAGLDAGLLPADLRYVGVTSSYPVIQDVSSSLIYFGLNSYRPWSTPNEVQFLIYIDSKGGPGGIPDGKDDFVLLNTSLGAVRASSTGQQPNDVFINLLYPIDQTTGALLPSVFFAFWNGYAPPSSDQSPDPAPFNTSSLVMLTSANLLGLSAAQPRFAYRIETRARDADNFSRVVDRVPALGQPRLNYSLTQATLTPINAGSDASFNQRPFFPDLTGSNLNVVINQTRLVAAGIRYMLLLHHHNQPTNQAQLVTLRPAQAP